ncbi:MAG: ribosomal RNA small subunit methyltransferase I, partial [Burkholderiaceae bacterium]
MSAAPLFLVPNSLDLGESPAPLTDVLPLGVIQQASQIRHWVVENAKSTRAFLKRVGESHPLAATLQAQQIVELPREVHKKGDHG